MLCTLYKLVYGQININAIWFIFQNSELSKQNLSQVNLTTRETQKYFPLFIK